MLKPIIQAIVDLGLALGFAVPRFSENSRANRKLFMMAVGSVGLLTGVSILIWKMKNLKRSMGGGIHNSTGLLRAGDNGRASGGIVSAVTGAGGHSKEDRSHAATQGLKSAALAVLL